MKRASLQSVMELFRKVVQKKHRQDNAPHRFGTDELMFQAEMYLLEVIGENRGLSVTELATLLGITKGAVSQTLKKLTAKGLAKKLVDPRNNARVTLELTASGQRAFLAHQRWHAATDQGFKLYLASLSEDDVALLAEFLTRFERFINAREAKLD